jgi:hypothetical protein
MFALGMPQKSLSSTACDYARSARIVSLLPSATEIIGGLGLAESSRRPIERGNIRLLHLPERNRADADLRQPISFVAEEGIGVDFGFCPRCGVARSDAFRWCRKCGFDFQNPPKPDATSSAPPSVQPNAAPPSTRIDVRPVGDRQAMAQWSRDAWDVRCLATLGGLIGIVLGFFVFISLGAMLHAGLFSIILGFIGVPVGFFLGVRIVLSMMAGGSRR